MPKAILVAKIVFLLIGILPGAYQEGVGAYYHTTTLKQVCEYRMSQGWSTNLDCSFPRLAASIDCSWLGDYVLADIPGHSYLIFHIVDCAQEEHIPRLLARGEVLEIDNRTAMEAGWTGYTDGVKVWRLE